MKESKEHKIEKEKFDENKYNLARSRFRKAFLTTTALGLGSALLADRTQ